MKFLDVSKLLNPSKLEWDRIPTDPNGPKNELLDTQVFSGSVQWVFLEISWIEVPEFNKWQCFQDRCFFVCLFEKGSYSRNLADGFKYFGNFRLDPWERFAI